MPEKSEARPFYAAHDRGPEMHTQVRFKSQGDKTVVVGFHSCPASIELAVYIERLTKEMAGLIDQVAAQIKEQTTTVLGGAQFAPGACPGHRPVALES